MIGMMVDQKDEAPQNVVTSLVWHMRPTVDAVIAQTENGPEGVDLGKFSFMKVLGSELVDPNTDVVGGVPGDLLTAVSTKEDAIMSGSFVTPIDESAPASSITVSKN